jgi:hydroxymethylglutaryl-CoA lyase
VCADQGETPAVVYLCDTVGAANPMAVRETLELARSRWPDLEFALHLHDTRGMGLANVLAGLECGVRRFDTSIAGLGGCPFAGNKAAAGNVCTEDVALMCEDMGISTGLDLEALAEAGRLAEKIVGHPLPGKFKNAGRIRSALPT